jgi:hypothetical protein
MDSEVLKRPEVKHNVNHWAFNFQVTKKNYQEASKTRTRNLRMKNSRGSESNSQRTLCWEKWNQSCMFLQTLKRCAMWNLQDLTSHSGGKLRQITFWMWVRYYTTQKTCLVIEDLHVSSQAGRNHFCQSTFQQRGRPVSLLSEEQAEVTSVRERGRSHFCQRTFQQWDRQVSLMSEISVARLTEVTSVSGQFSSEASRIHFCQWTTQ